MQNSISLTQYARNTTNNIRIFSYARVCLLFRDDDRLKWTMTTHTVMKLDTLNVYSFIWKLVNCEIVWLKTAIPAKEEKERGKKKENYKWSAISTLRNELVTNKLKLQRIPGKSNKNAIRKHEIEVKMKKKKKEKRKKKRGIKYWAIFYLVDWEECEGRKNVHCNVRDCHQASRQSV